MLVAAVPVRAPCSFAAHAVVPRKGMLTILLSYFDIVFELRD
jgi:hypothetical protein